VEAGKKKDAPKNGNGATLGFEEKLWQAADKLRDDTSCAGASTPPSPRW